MARLVVQVNSLACEADEETIVEDLLAQDGITDASLDLRRDACAIEFDADRTDEAAIVAHLDFYGVAPEST